MALSIRDKATESLARAMAQRRGVTITQIVSEALQEKYHNDPKSGPERTLVDEMMEVAQRCGKRAILDTRSPDAILGYDRHGTFGTDPTGG